MQHRLFGPPHMQHIAPDETPTGNALMLKVLAQIYEVSLLRQ